MRREGACAGEEEAEERVRERRARDKVKRTEEKNRVWSLRDTARRYKAISLLNGFAKLI
jgi:hypothetical protein